MASKNSRKTYVKNGYYHVYNRGVEKRVIFKDVQDYKVFLNYIKEYLSLPPDPKELTQHFTLQDQVFKGIPKQPKNYHEEIDLICFCLMPNHFHLLIKQANQSSMSEFIHSLLLRYTMYFNKRYERVGRLYQGRYKAILIENDEYLLHLSRYIHLNPSEFTNDLASAYSSYSDYLGLTNTLWLKPKTILKFFNQPTIPEIVDNKLLSYRNFVETYKMSSESVLGKITIDSDL